MLLLDNSAWSRLITDSVPKDRQEVVLNWIEDGRLATCLPFLLEAGYSALSARDHRVMLDRLGQLPHLQIDREVERTAQRAQRELAESGHHRLPPNDLILAACAACAHGGVLHYDRDYDLIREHTGLVFESVWLSEPGFL